MRSAINRPTLLSTLSLATACGPSAERPQEGYYRTGRVIESTTCTDPKYPAEYRPDYGFDWTSMDEHGYEIWFVDDSDGGIIFPCTMNGSSFTCAHDTRDADVGCGDIVTTYAVEGEWRSAEEMSGTFTWSTSGTIYGTPCVDLCAWTFEFSAAYDP